MRLLSSTLLLLLAVSSSLGAPTAAPSNEDSDRPTTIEILYETVTKTIIHDVTDAPVITKEEETTVIKTEEEPVAADSEANTVTEVKELTDNERLDKLEKKLAKAMRLLELLKTPKLPAADVITNIRMCSCEEASECRKESTETMTECMEECDSLFERDDNTTATFVDCFSKHNASIIQAEECLFKNNDNNAYCTEKDTVKTIEVVDWEQYNNINYTANASSEIKDNALWTKHEAKYTKMQNFFTCTKNCMHKKLQTCTSTKGCAMQMPTVADFTAQMNQCTKKNAKIAQSIVSACQCIAWTNKIKDHQGICTTIGNQYFIDRA